MKKAFFIIIILITTLTGNALSQSQTSSNIYINEQYNTWTAPEPMHQLEKEGIDDQLGMGRIFVPAMSDPTLEPEYMIYKNGQLERGRCPVGQSIFLEPGSYTLEIGSGLVEEQKMKIDVTLKAGQTRIIEPTWGSLIVTIIDQNRNYLREAYEIYQIDDYKNSIGMKYSVDENQPGEKQETWLLKPGVYKIIKYKESPKTFTNFTTIRVMEGMLEELTIVMESTTKNFIGAGLLPEMKESDQIHAWKYYTSIKGSFLLSSDNSANKDKSVTNITLSAKLDNEIKYDAFPHYFSSRQNLNIGFTKEQDKDFRIYSNSLHLQPTYIFYFIKSFGVYGRFRLNSNVFPTMFYFDSAQPTIYKINTEGDTVDTILDDDKVQITPMLYPISLEEGFGLNLTVFNTNTSNLYIKTGLGFSQTLNSNVYEQDATDTDVFRELESVNLSGFEGNVGGDFRISNNINYIFEFYTLYPFEKSRKQIFRFDNTVSFRISSYVSLDYTLTVKQDETKTWTQVDHNLSLDLTIISF